MARLGLIEGGNALIFSAGQPNAYFLHPLHALLLGFPTSLFVGALLSDLAYAASYQIQWTNFASWLIVGGLIMGGAALLWALIDWLRAGRPRHGRLMLYPLLLLAAWVIGFFNALVHAKDAWGAMPEGLILSAITAPLVLAAAFIGYSGPVQETR